MKADTVELENLTGATEALGKVAGTLAAVVGAVWAAGRWFWPEWRVYRENRQLIESFRDNFGPKAADRVHEMLRQLTHRANTHEMRTGIAEFALGIGTYVCDAKTGECIVANDVLADMWGVPKESLKGLGWLQCVTNKSKALEEWQFAYTNHIPYHSSYEITNARTNERMDIETAAFPMGYGKDLECYAGWVRKVRR